MVVIDLIPYHKWLALTFSAALAGIYVLSLWEGGGSRWFYFYQEGYKLVFHT